MSASDTLWSEFQACLKFGLDPEAYFAKDRFMRMYITGGVIADNAISAMRQHDIAKDREQKSKIKGKGKK